MGFDIHSIHRQLFKIWRVRRQRLFDEKLQPQKDESMLDIGGYPSTWIARDQPVKQIDCLNIHEVDWDGSQWPNHQIRTLVGDGCALEFGDKSYDIAFANSVIEHVGDWEKQKAFANEVRRVGRRIWVQTPAYECPIEPHYLAPFVHWVPLPYRRFVAHRLTPWGWLQKPDKATLDRWMDTTRLIKKKEMEELFPDCEILTERLFGLFRKSYVAYRKG